MEGRWGRTFYEEMSAAESKREKLAGLSLDDILVNQQRPGSTPPSSTTPRQPPPKSRTLIDIIKDDESNKKDRR